MKNKLSFTVAAVILSILALSFCSCRKNNNPSGPTATPTPYAVFKITNTSPNYISCYYDYTFLVQHCAIVTAHQKVVRVQVLWNVNGTMNSATRTCSILYDQTEDVSVPIPATTPVLYFDPATATYDVTVYNEFGNSDTWRNMTLVPGSTHIINLSGYGSSTYDSTWCYNGGYGADF